MSKPKPFRHDPRLLAHHKVGDVLVRELADGSKVAAVIRERGYEFRGKLYKSLSGVAKAATGSTWFGLVFFRVIPWGAAAGFDRRKYTKAVDAARKAAWFLPSDLKVDPINPDDLAEQLRQTSDVLTKTASELRRAATWIEVTNGRAT